MRLGLSLSLPMMQATAGVAASAITNLTVMGTTLLDATNAYSDATSRPGVDGNGWVAMVTVPYQVGQTFDPTKITLTLSDPGYTAAGTTTVTRTIRGGRILRRQYTVGGAQSNKMQSNDGVTLTVYFSLIGDNAEICDVYQGTTVTASAASGFYGSSASGAVSSVTNSSTRAYEKPGWTWIGRHHQACGSGGQYVEGLAVSKFARNGRQVARVEYTATDAHSNTSAVQTVSAPTLSTTITKGQPPEVYSATIPVTALTQADLCQVSAKVYPWIGDSTAVLTLSTDGLNTTGSLATANPQTTFRFFNDKAGTYTGAHAAVKAGASGGTVQATRALAETTPFPTILAAIAALPAWNNSNKGHNSHDGSKVWLMDNGAGGAVQHSISGDNSTVATSKNCLTEIRQSPSNTATASVLQGAATYYPTWGLSWHVDIAQDAGGHFFDGADSTTAQPMSYYCDGTYTMTNTNNPLTYRQLAGVLNLTQAGDGVLDLSGGPAVRGEIICWHGHVNTVVSSNYSCRVRSVVGCSLTRIAVSEFDPTSLVLHDNQDGKIWVNNVFSKMQAASYAGGTYNMSRGFFFAQNVLERAVVIGGVQALSIGDLNTTFVLDNVVVTNNTIIGDRFNLLYTDNAVSVLKRTASRLNLLDQINTKSDVYTTDSTATGRTGDWEFINGCNRWDGIINGDSNSIYVPADGAWLGEYLANAGNTHLTRAAVTFTNDLANNTANSSTGTGGGTYSLTGGGNAAYNLVPTGKAAFTYDIAGVARKNDGTGAAGAYERTV